MGKHATNPPKIFRVNWFQRNERGRFLWPGFGENLRVLRWVVERSKGGGQADETPIGYVPKASSLNGGGLEVSKSDLDQLVSVDREGWKNNLEEPERFLRYFRRSSAGGHQRRAQGAGESAKELTSGGVIMARGHHDIGGLPGAGPIDQSEHQLSDWEILADAVNQALGARGHQAHR